MIKTRSLFRRGYYGFEYECHQKNVSAENLSQIFNAKHASFPQFVLGAIKFSTKKHLKKFKNYRAKRLERASRISAPSILKRVYGIASNRGASMGSFVSSQKPNAPF